jgi:hypothetical protein
MRQDICYEVETLCKEKTTPSVMPHLLQKGVSENFDFHVTLRHHQSYKLAAEYIFLIITH